ncbi:MAG: DHA2 family efflux MFS transporter permease subunit [Simkaniaceae bacterium]|nr:MAG: DHA2 family efflux MFS transporter permease subunit [Simkaniaceae bacterium]
MNGNPLTGITLFLGAIALSLCTFMQVLDYSIANVSIPYIAGDLATSVTDGTWVITMFAVGNAIALPLTGLLTRRLGSIRVMVLSVALFTLFSWLCGMSINMNMLVVMRFIQGVVAGPMIPLSQSLMIMTFPKEKRNLALALWNMVAVVGPIAGPILGGWITFNYSWPWIFFINIPVGIFCVLVIRSLYKKKETKTEKVRIDGLGILLLAFAVSALQIILDQGQQLDWWRSNIIIALAVVSVVSFVFLFIWELTHDTPIMDLRMFKNRNFFIGTVITALSYMVLFGVIVITPLWLQEMMGYTAQVAGLAVSTMGVLPFFTVVLVAKLMDKVRLKYLVALSFFSYGVVLFYYSTFTTAVSFEVIALSRLLLGIGICTWLAPITAITFARVPTEKLAMGQGMFHFFRILMGGVGTSIFVTVWERRGTHHHSNIIDSINQYNPISRELFADLKQYGIVGKKALTVVDTMAWKQAMMLSLNDIFWLGGWVFMVLLILPFFFEKRKHLSADQLPPIGH